MRLAVVGSGPSGVHAARTLIERGHEVVMFDVGRERPEPVAPGVPFAELAATLADPAAYLLGARFEGVILPSAGKEYYGLPPSKGYVLEERADVGSEGFEPLFSAARGGLAEAWTAGVYPFSDAELAEFPFGYADLAPHYSTVARRIGINGDADDLARFFPVHEGIMPPLRLDAHSALLLKRYAARAAELNRDGVWMGRSRIAVLTADQDGRRACDYLGRCLWGCPHDALYTPSVTLRQLAGQARFTYLPGSAVTHFAADADGRITSLSVRGAPLTGSESFDGLVLAAGALESARIYLESLWRRDGEQVRLDGLMDNQQLLVPFVSPRMAGRGAGGEGAAERSYQYHQVCAGLAADNPAHYIHAQLTTLTTAMAHPVIASLPLDLRTATVVFRLLRTALGIANVNLHDTRRPDCTAALDPGAAGAPGRLRLRYVAAPGDEEHNAAALRRMKRVLRSLGCILPPGMSYVRPKGASVHYAGLVPMTRGEESRHTATPEGKSRAFSNLWFADGITFPFLPAKNITFTLMANADRVARTIA